MSLQAAAPTRVVDCQRLAQDIEAINRCNASPDRGVTRFTFSPEYEAAGRYLVDQMQAIGLVVTMDDVGNLFGKLAGSDASLPCVMVGSHIDTVPSGGRFDGVVGTAAALEIARCVASADGSPRRGLIVAVFAEEDGSRFGQVLAGSMGLIAAIEPAMIRALRDAEGLEYGELLESMDIGVVDRTNVALESVHCMLELHVEQSVVLEAAGVTIGVVETIVGRQGLLVDITGVANHAGATPMTQRRDALAAAAEIVLAIESIGLTGRGTATVATVGSIECAPNAANVIPGWCRLGVDIRDSSVRTLHEATERAIERIKAVEVKRDVNVTVVRTPPTQPVHLSAEIAGLFEASARARHLSWRRMTSGAVHDAAAVGQVVDAGMVFVPSRGGRSHVPEEWSSLADVCDGANVLLDTVWVLCWER